MAFITTDKPVLRLSTLALRPFVWIWNALIAISEAHPKLAEVNKLNTQTDADLAARGTTREDEIRRIFSGQFYL